MHTTRHHRVLSNGRYSTLITSAGLGGSFYDSLALTNWRSDPVGDDGGHRIFLRDLDDQHVWQVGGQGPAALHWSWEPGHFLLRQENHGIDLTVRVCVLPDANVEIRRVSLINQSDRPRRIELTSYVEVVLAEPAAHRAHPEFSKLFLQTRFVAESGSLVASRRPRTPTEHHPCLVHALLGSPVLEWETDRVAFVGRGETVDVPRALRPGSRLTGATGNVLDPALSLRTVVELPVDGSASVDFILGVAEQPEQAGPLVGALKAVEARDVAFDGAAEHETRFLADLGIDPAEAEALQSLGTQVVAGAPLLRACPEVQARARGDLSDLVAFGLSTHRHLAVVHCAGADASFVRACNAQRYWRWCGLPIDVLILSDAEASPFIAPRQDADEPRVLPTRELTPSEFDLIHASAHLVVQDDWPDASSRPEQRTPDTSASLHTRRSDDAAPWDHPLREPTTAPHRYGSFTGDGCEYVLPVRVQPGDPQLPPRPWVNVVANPRFGFVISETGASTTWSENSRTHRLTPWLNDALLDPHSEAFYVRDDRSLEFWSALPGPAPLPGDYEVRHGFGYSRFRHGRTDLHHDTVVFATQNASLKVTAIAITNTGDTARRLSVFSYAQIVMGSSPEDSGRLVVTEADPESGAILARNRLAGALGDQVAYSAAISSAHARATFFSTDRVAFVGTGRTLASPVAVANTRHLDGASGARLDPCLALQVVLDVPPGETARVFFVLGEEGSAEAIASRLDEFEEPNALNRLWIEDRAFWHRTLSAIQITTPSEPLNRIANGWLLYQTLSCRLWGRTAFYQSGGAFGFRDQLQDASALMLTKPELVRDQILLHASHQFSEGDVLHWWHPPTDEGIRTRFADDLIWLPFITASYVEATGDLTILEEIAPFVTARPLESGEDEAYLFPQRSDGTATVYEHCCLALDRALTQGEHGLPLFQAGDWNDGMNRVGREGRGESVWLGQFLYATFGAFAPLCVTRGDAARAAEYAVVRERLRTSVNEAWDGDWYRRGYYDDGAPLGSKLSDECQIDGLTQAWAVISGVASSERADRALRSVEQRLVSEEHGMIRLLDPPFDQTPHDPGYIKGYVRGVRENGGQYTHAALWVVMAMARLGWRDRAASRLEMLSPVSHSDTAEKVATYQLEPYVVAADVYGEEPHVGRGGWSWYTGSAGWMLRVMIEDILGVRIVNGDSLRITPCIPDEWPEYAVRIRLPEDDTEVVVHVSNPEGKSESIVAATVDGSSIAVAHRECVVPLVRDGGSHRVELVLGRTS